jgi:predicted nucleotidyltransferase
MASTPSAPAQSHIPIPYQALAEFCQRNHIRRLALFGSVLRHDFRPDSDVDVLVDFEPGTQVGMFTLIHMQDELANLVQRPVDLVLQDGLKPVIRDSVLNSALEIYAN